MALHEVAGPAQGSDFSCSATKPHRSGLAFGAGVDRWIWHGRLFRVAVSSYLELPNPGPKTERVAKKLISVGVVLVAGLFLWRATVWQNSIRELMVGHSVSRQWSLVDFVQVTALFFV